MRVDCDLWLCALDLALALGWDPEGVDPHGDSYVLPRGQRVTEADARELARCFERALEYVPDDLVPLSGCDFGDEHTIGLLLDAEQGNAPSGAVVTGAREVLSGPPKAQALKLIAYLRGGRFAICAGR